MKVIAVMTPKGGVGKTTTSTALTYILGQEMGARVLLVDADPQGDSSTSFGINDESGLTNLLENHITTGGRYSTRDIIYHTRYSNIDIVPAGGFEVSAIENLNMQLAEIRVFNRNVEVKVLLNMARNTLAFKGMETWVKQRSGLGYFSTNIKQSTVIEQATLKKLPLPEHAKKADVTASYRKIVEEIVREVG